MDHSRYEAARGIWLDARRALWLAESRTLAVADLHLGYVWAHRHGGQLMPISVPDDTSERLVALQQAYQPEQVVLLGDIVHRAVPIAPIKDELMAVLECFPTAMKVHLVAGNHDRNLGRLLEGQRTQLTDHVQVGGCIFLHGDVDSVAATQRAVQRTRAERQWIVIGHEHPSATLGDGVATWEKYPCFLICDGLIVLPAFSRWAAGNSREEYMSPLLTCTSVKLKVAILDDRLLPLRPE